MATRPQKSKLYLREHRTAKKVSASTMAAKLGIERESVLRLERELWRVNSEKQAEYAAVLGISPQALWRPPGVVSIDDMLEDEDADMRSTAVGMIELLKKQRK